MPAPFIICAAAQTTDSCSSRKGKCNDLFSVVHEGIAPSMVANKKPIQITLLGLNKKLYSRATVQSWPLSWTSLALPQSIANCFTFWNSLFKLFELASPSCSYPIPMPLSRSSPPFGTLAFHPKILTTVSISPFVPLMTKKKKKKSGQLSSAYHQIATTLGIYFLRFGRGWHHPSPKFHMISVGIIPVKKQWTRLSILTSRKLMLMGMMWSEFLKSLAKTRSH